MIYRREKRAFSLSILEIMIVILLISIIGGAIGYNLKGSLDKGKAFKTVQAREQLRDLLLLSVAEGKSTMKDAAKNPQGCLEEMGLAKKPEELVRDGWGGAFKIKVDKEGTDFIIFSKTYDNYIVTHGGKKDAKEAEAAEAEAAEAAQEVGAAGEAGQ